MDDLNYIHQTLYNEYKSGILTRLRFSLKEYHPVKKYKWDWNYLISIIYESLYFNLYSLNDLIYLMCVNKQTYNLMKLMITNHPINLPFYKYRGFPTMVFFNGTKYVLYEWYKCGKRGDSPDQLLPNIIFCKKIWHPKLQIKLSTFKMAKMTYDYTIMEFRDKWFNKYGTINYKNYTKSKQKQIRKLYFRSGFDLIDVPKHKVKLKPKYTNHSTNIKQPLPWAEFRYDGSIRWMSDPWTPPRKSETNYQNKISNRMRRNPKKYNMNLYHTTGFKRHKK